MLAVLSIKEYRWMHGLTNFLYFGAASISIGWIIRTYGRFDAVFSISFGVGLFFLLLTSFAFLTLLPAKRFKFPGFNFKEGNHRLIRLSALLMPVPILVYCAYFSYCVLSYDKSQAAEYRLLNFSKFEKSIFPKSVIYDYFSKADIIDFGNYMHYLQSKIKQNWQPTDNEDPLEAKYIFTAMRDGSIRDVKLARSSKSKNFDETALKALNAAAPLQLLPAYWPDDNLHISFSFNSNVRSNTAESSDKEFLPYLKDLVAHIGSKWRDLSGDLRDLRDLFAQTSFNISADGAISDIRLDSSSGSSNLDNSALESIRKSAPFASFPSSVSAKIKHIVISFDRSFVWRNGGDAFSSGPRIPKEFNYGTINEICPKPSAEDLNNDACKLLKAGDFAAATKELKSCRDLYPTYGLAILNQSITYNNWALQCCRKKNFEEGVSLFLDSLECLDLLENETSEVNAANYKQTLENLAGAYSLWGLESCSKKDFNDASFSFWRALDYRDLLNERYGTKYKCDLEWLKTYWKTLCETGRKLEAEKIEKRIRWLKSNA
jgi:TonB family protein